MNSIQVQAIQSIETQQKKVPARSAPWMVGEQLKDICRLEPLSAELIAQDMQNQAMGIIQAEKKIKAFADGHKTDSFSCVTPIEADRILREFYGLPPAGKSPEAEAVTPAPSPSGRINALDFL